MIMRKVNGRIVCLGKRYVKPNTPGAQQGKRGGWWVETKGRKAGVAKESSQAMPDWLSTPQSPQALLDKAKQPVEVTDKHRAQVIPTSNKDFGFFGTIGGDKEQAWNDVASRIIGAGYSPKQAKEFLDSSAGRRLADHIDSGGSFHSHGEIEKSLKGGGWHRQRRAIGPPKQSKATQPKSHWKPRSFTTEETLVNARKQAAEGKLHPSALQMMEESAKAEREDRLKADSQLGPQLDAALDDDEMKVDDDLLDLDDGPEGPPKRGADVNKLLDQAKTLDRERATHLINALTAHINGETYDPYEGPKNRMSLPTKGIRIF